MKEKYGTIIYIIYSKMIPQIIIDADIRIYNKLEPIWDTLSHEAQDIIVSLLYSQSEFEWILLERALERYPNFDSTLEQKIKIEKQKVINEMEEEDKNDEINNFNWEIL